ncbi:MAG: aldo/keto reductase [Candidatus Magasanikbacteria bacterium]
MKKISLNQNCQIPILGFGTWQLKDKEGRSAIEKALEVGYRHIDTADIYGNHKEVGKSIQVSNIDRGDIFLTSKIWHSDLESQQIIDNTKRFLEELQTEYLDLLLIHWPNKDIEIAESLEAMNKLKDDGLIKSVGVSNFTIKHLKEALETGFDFSNNQVEFHPSLYQPELKQFCEENDIVMTAYSPIGQGQDLDLPIIQEMAEKYNKPECQVILNWIIQKDIVAIPRSSNPQHIQENFGATDWILKPEDIKKVNNKAAKNNRIINPSIAEFDY